MRGEPPKLRTNVNGLVFSDGFVNFVNMMTIADSEQRPKYDKLLAADYLRAMALHRVDVATYFSTVLGRMTEADFMGVPVEEGGFRY